MSIVVGVILGVVVIALLLIIESIEDENERKLHRMKWDD